MPRLFTGVRHSANQHLRTVQPRDSVPHAEDSRVEQMLNTHALDGAEPSGEITICPLLHPN